MSIQMRSDGDSVYRLEVSGQLRKDDLERCQDVLIREMARVGPVKLLFVLRDFEGWNPDDGWNDLGFYIRHGHDIARLAIVGDERWRSEALMFAGADLRDAPVEYFEPGAEAEARAWLSASSAGTHSQKGKSL
ncbi:MAG TPA: STAS/SEC14 domain-containing protein [Vicinamibacterales bacterium]|nr:STAS/SEC14 domain-containing protein [Vicinamibacterales bacterium]